MSDYFPVMNYEIIIETPSERAETIFFANKRSFINSQQYNVSVDCFGSDCGWFLFMIW